jgi:subtilase family serine protease
MRAALLPVLALVAAVATGCSLEDDSDDRPDLTIAKATVTPALPVAGDTVQVVFQVVNRGASTATGAAWRISLGITAVTGTLPELRKGGTTTISHAFTATDPTNVTVTATVDPGGAVDESDEANNSLSALVTIGLAAGG